MQILSQNKKSSEFFLWANPEDLSAQEHNMALRIY